MRAEGEETHARRTNRAVRCAIGLLVATLLPAAAGADGENPSAFPVRPHFVGEEVVTTNEGHADLRWELPARAGAVEDLTFELQRSRDPAFSEHRLLHEGSESAYFVSGLRDGRNYFRVRAVRPGSPPGPWSETQIVDVAYPDSVHVVLLLAVGAVVFAATITAIGAGWLRSRRAAPAAGRAR